jgi:hypothetical protein
MQAHATRRYAYDTCTSYTRPCTGYRPVIAQCTCTYAHAPVYAITRTYAHADMHTHVHAPTHIRTHVRNKALTKFGR